MSAGNPVKHYGFGGTERMIRREIDRVLAPHGLRVTGLFRPGPEDDAPAETGLLCLIGAGDGRMWNAFRSAPEATDGRPDPLDRWSARVIGGAAAAFGAKALFPFGGPPFRPFLRWAARAEGARVSPLGMSVTPERGLWASWRGALAFGEGGVGEAEPRRDSFPNPCAGCPAPCLSGCPVAAFTGSTYDVSACTAHLRGAEGSACLTTGCRARHACPVSAPPPPEQAAFHLAAFLDHRSPPCDKGPAG